MNNINESTWRKDFDFIEESYGYSEPLEFTEVKEDIIVESEMGKPSTYKILGKASGVFQTVGGYSRNKRFYCPEHWEIQLNNTHVQDRLAKRDIMGTLGHSADRPVNDADIAAGLVSHLVTKLEIREDLNGKPYLYGELEILDTPAGRILKALYEGGANLYVSSRGAGKLEPMPDQAGIMRVNPHSYWFEGFDMVRRPGFIEAKPVFEQVKESTNESVNEEAIEEEVISSTQSVSQDSSPSEIETLKAQINKLAAVVEKVVDDVYEVDEKCIVDPTEEIHNKAEQVKANINAPANKKALKEFIERNKQIAESEQFVDFIKLLSETDVSEDVLGDIFGMIFNGENK